MAPRSLLLILVTCALVLPGTTSAQGAVTGTVVIREKGGRPGTGVGDAVVWLEGVVPRAPAAQVDIGTQDKRFAPRVVTVPVGSTIHFPNHDPFNHNVFSRSEAATFDLGLYGRGEIRSATVPRAGVVRVYCNIHATMSAVVVVVAGPLVAQPGADGSFTIPGVPPGTYTLHAWHERGGESSRPVEVPRGGLAGVALALDASGFRPGPHLNKYGKKYPAAGRKY